MVTRILFIIGVVGSIVTIFCIAVYFISIEKSHPKLISRMANQNEDCGFIYGKEGRLGFGFSTDLEKKVILTAVCLNVSNQNFVEFLANDLFKPRITTTNNVGISLCWEGQESLRKKHFLVFWMPFRVLTPSKDTVFSIIISATAILDVSHWTFPWSMFSLYPRTTVFTEKITWCEKSPDGKNCLLNIGPGESCYIIGTLAEESIQATGKDINVEVTEIFKDETYKITKFKSDSKK